MPARFPVPAQGSIRQRRSSRAVIEPDQALLGSLDLTDVSATVYDIEEEEYTDGLVTEISTSVFFAQKLLTITTGGSDRLTVSDWTNPEAPRFILQERLAGFELTSVASSGNLVAVAITPEDYADPGYGQPPTSFVRFYRLNPSGQLSWIEDVETGFLTDSVVFSADGSRLLAVNEGQPNDDYSLDPEGSITIIEIGGQGGNLRFSRRPVSLDLELDGNGLIDDPRVDDDEGAVRFSGKEGVTTSFARDAEPEYAALLGGHAYVTLQENNAVAKIDLDSGDLVHVFGLGAVDYALVSVDLDDRDGGFLPKDGQAVLGLRMPDTLVAYTAEDGNDYFATANEGDAREYDGYVDEIRNRDLAVPYALPERLKLIRNGNIAENAATQEVLVDDGSGGFAFDAISDADGPDGTPYSFGSRSLSIFDADDGTLVWDSWMADEITGVAGVADGTYNTSLQNIAAHAGVYPDGRSDDKGVEPEGLTLASFQGRTYLIAGLERTEDASTEEMAPGEDREALIDGGMVVVYDVTKPTAVDFVTYELCSIAPEGLEVIPAERSPSGRMMLGVSSEAFANTIQKFDFEALLNNGRGVDYLMNSDFADPTMHPTLPPPPVN